MGADPHTLTGGCMCGAVRYEATGKPLAVGHCHCKSCRQHTGAPVVTYVGFKADQVVFKGRERSLYASSPGVARAFCSTCGSSLTWEGKPRGADGKLIELHISTLDDPNSLSPEDHTRYGERLTWFDVADDLPRYQGVPADGDPPCCYGPADA